MSWLTRVERTTQEAFRCKSRSPDWARSEPFGNVSECARTCCVRLKYDFDRVVARSLAPVIFDAERW